MKLFSPIPLRTIPPNVITAVALALGMASIWSSLSATDVGGLRRAAWFVLLATLLDKLDGSVARWLRGNSEFGVQFDSLADNIAYGLAPAALVFAAAPILAGNHWGPSALVGGLPAVTVLGAACLVYGVLTSVRLARFNATTAVVGPFVFLGLPSTLSGGLICSAFLAIFELGLDRSHPGLFAWFPVLLGINAALMVCNLPLPKLKASKNKVFHAFQAIGAVAVYIMVPAQKGFTVVLAALLCYLAIGFTVLGPRALEAGRVSPAEAV